MLKWKYAYLSLALIEFAVGFSNARANVFFYLGLPLGAIFFCLFLIFQLLEKESALYDQEHRAPEPVRQAARTAPRQPSISRPKQGTNPASYRTHSR